MTMEELLVHGETNFSAPQVACKLNRLLKESRFLDELVAVIKYDPGLTARILQICNTAGYRGSGSISSLEDAVNRLGNEKLISIVWQASMSKQMAGALTAYRFSPGTIWRHSVTTAIAAEGLWKSSRVEVAMATSFTAGLLHDIGKVLISRSLSMGHDFLFQQHVEENFLEVHEAESMVLGFNHAELGGKLLEKWEQDEALISSVSCHHHPVESPLRHRKLTALVAVADHLAHHYDRFLDGRTIEKFPQVNPHLLNMLEISQAQLIDAYGCIEARKEEVEVMMAII